MWLGRHSPVSETAAGAKPEAPVAADKKSGTENLAAFLSRSEPEAAGPEADEEEELDEAAQLAAAKAAIPAGADVAALVKASADPDSWVSIETRAAFGLWVDRDPVAALRWLTEWRRDTYLAARDLDAEFTRHLLEGGLAKLGFYLREVPLARDFLLSAATEESISSCFGSVTRPADKLGSAEILQVASTLDSPGERLSFLRGHFSSVERCLSHLPQIRALLDDRSAARFLAEIHGGELTPEQAAELEAAGFPAHALAQFLEEHRPAEEAVGLGRDLAAAGLQIGFGQTRTNADFIGTIANTSIPGVPEATGTNVTDIVTNGLRRGDGPINRNNIDAVLNNPNRSASAMTPQQAGEKIRNFFESVDRGNGGTTDWLEVLPSYDESREDFLRGKITGQELLTRLQGEIPGGGDLRDELSTLVFHATVEEDPRRAQGLLDATTSNWDLLMGLSLPPEILVSMAGRLSGDGPLSEEMQSRLGYQMEGWKQDDPEAYAGYLERLPAGPVRDFLQPPDEGEDKEGEQ